MPTDAIETENQEEPQVAEKPLDKMTGTKPTLNTKELKKKILVLRKE